MVKTNRRQWVQEIRNGKIYSLYLIQSVVKEKDLGSNMIKVSVFKKLTSVQSDLEWLEAGKPTSQMEINLSITVPQISGGKNTTILL